MVALREFDGVDESERVAPTIERQRRWPRLNAVESLAIALLIAALIARFVARPFAPFWIDEAATGSIVSQPTFAAFWRDAYWHVSSPLYFVLLRGWSEIFGLSNFALRFPSALLSITAPLCIVFWPLKGLSRQDKLVWAAVFASWLPGVGYGQTARPYALELLFATIQTLAFITLLQRTTLKTAALWVGAAALTISTHYLSAILALIQGLIFLAWRREQAVKQWPALLLLLPVLALVAWQGPEMARFMTPETSWYKVYNSDRVLSAILYPLGGPLWIFALPLLLTAAVAFGFGRLKAPTPIYGIYLWVALASVVACGVLITIGAHRPILTNRYLAPFAPGAALFLVVALRILARGAGRAISVALLATCATVLLFWATLLHGHHSDSVVEELNYERASHDVMKAGAKSVVFMWDNPNARAMHIEQIASYGRFFFLRERYPIEVIPARPTLGADPNKILLAAAQPKRSAIIWVYDTWVDGTNARVFPPRIPRLDASYDCLNYNRPMRNFGIVVCIPKERQ